MAQNPPYYNSNEPGCDGSDANILFAEDFANADALGGHWWSATADEVNGPLGSNIYVKTKGWNGYPSFTNAGYTDDPIGAAINGGGIGGSWCATHGNKSNYIGSSYIADHCISSDGVNKTTVTEVYVRWYQKWLTGYIFSGEKVLTVQRFGEGFGGIKWGNVHINQGIGTPSSSGTLQWQGIDGSGAGETQNSIIGIVPGHWMCIEMHIILSTNNSTANGTLQFWADDCGTDGLTHGASQTLQYSTTSRIFYRLNAADQIGAFWWENWANSGAGQGSTGESYLANIVVSKAPIGFFAEGGDVTPPTLSAPNAGTPTSVGTTNASVSTNEGNGLLYRAAVTNGGSCTDAQLKAGAGGNIVAVSAGNQAVSGTGVQVVATIIGLSPSTLYQIKFLHRDAAGNDSTQASVNLTTAAGSGRTAKRAQYARRRE